MGLPVGSFVGDRVGDFVVCLDGARVGLRVGAFVGVFVGNRVGAEVGFFVLACVGGGVELGLKPCKGTPRALTPLYDTTNVAAAEYLVPK